MCYAEPSKPRLLGLEGFLCAGMEVASQKIYRPAQGLLLLDSELSVHIIYEVNALVQRPAPLCRCIFISSGVFRCRGPPVNLNFQNFRLIGGTDLG